MEAFGRIFKLIVNKIHWIKLGVNKSYEFTGEKGRRIGKDVKLMKINK